MDAKDGKPRSVTLAVTLLWISLTIGVAKMPFDPAGMKAVPFPALVWSIAAVIMAFFCVLIFKISSGRNWARITFLVLFLVGLLVGVPGLMAEFQRVPLLALVSVVASVMQLWAVILLFTSPGKGWFGKKAADATP
ncbi:MAG TPA: hypothetical protein VJQ51_03430 [Burkholderiales bacterium]|nr:hypothetical protein [Burkholderiales bacterium]